MEENETAANSRSSFCLMVISFSNFPYFYLFVIIASFRALSLRIDFNFLLRDGDIGPSNKYIFRVGVGDILILLTVESNFCRYCHIPWRGNRENALQK
jgi:hypothetical protein